MRLLTKLLLAIIPLFLINCKNDKTAKPADKELTSDRTHAYTLTPFTNSTAYPEAKLSLVTFQNGKFDFDVKSESYELGLQTPDAEAKMCANSAKGQHIHLIIGTDPYIAKYTSEFDQEVRDGEHHLLAFISRSYHESIKTSTSYLAETVTIKDNTITDSKKIEGEMLFYSRPKGTYVGKANTEKVMLDFFLVNSNLGSDRKVLADINGEKHLIEKWQPYYIEGLPMGKNKITLTLVNAKEERIDIAGNPVTREFELQMDPADNM